MSYITPKVQTIDWLTIKYINEQIKETGSRTLNEAEGATINKNQKAKVVKIRKQPLLNVLQLSLVLPAEKSVLLLLWPA